jgi:BlaI family penicillinase repressor
MKPIRLGRMQLQILQFLWAHGPATAREITDHLNKGRFVAHTTVQTVLRQLENKRAIDHTVNDRTFVFRALVEENAVASSTVMDVVDRVFRGKISDLVSMLIEEERVTPEEMSKIRKLVARYQPKHRNKPKD